MPLVRNRSSSWGATASASVGQWRPAEVRHLEALLLYEYLLEEAQILKLLGIILAVLYDVNPVSIDLVDNIKKRLGEK